VRGAIEHAILAEAGILWRGALLTPGPESRDTALSMLDAAAQKVLEEAPARLEIQPSAIWPWEREAIHRRMRNAVERLWDDESDWAAFSPYVFELRFGGAAGLPAVPLGTSAGMVMLQGRIDRIDRREDGALALIDYKAGGAHSMRASLSGDDVQLAIYTLAAEHMGAPEARVDRAAFVHIGHGRHEGTLEGEQIGQAVTAATDRIGYVAANARSGDFRVRPRECPSFCAFEVICRKNLAKRT
jgi:ATP-dependent helicase/DNAse subunit B